MRSRGCAPRWSDWIIANTCRPAAIRPPPWISPKSPRCRTARYVPERLLEDLFPVGDEQQGQIAVPFDELAVVECSDDGLPGARRGDDEVAVPIVALALDHERVEHALLMRVRPHVKAGERDRRCLAERALVVLVKCPLQLLAVDGRVVELEVLRRPMALEHHPHAVDDMRGVHRGQPDVPLQAVEQRACARGSTSRQTPSSARSHAQAATPWRGASSFARRTRPGSQRRALNSSSTARFSVVAHVRRRDRLGRARRGARRPRTARADAGRRSRSRTRR